MNALRALVGIYRNPSYRHFGIRLRIRFRNIAQLYVLRSVTTLYPDQVDTLVQGVYRSRRIQGVTMNQTLTRLTHELQAGVDPAALARFYGLSPLTFKRKNDQ